MGFPVF